MSAFLIKAQKRAGGEPQFYIASGTNLAEACKLLGQYLDGATLLGGVELSADAVNLLDISDPRLMLWAYIR